MIHKPILFRKCFLAVGLLLSAPAFAVDTDVLIPLTQRNLPANDLVYKGKVLTETQALNQRDDNGKLIDLTTLDPDDSSDLWKKTPQNEIGAKEDEALPVSEKSVVDFAGRLFTGEITDKVKFNINSTVHGTPQIFTVLLGKTLHTYLLRKEILRKLGYRIPAMKYLKQLQVHFLDKAERDDFIKKELMYNLNSDPGRWIVDYSADSEALTLTFQDIVVTDATPTYYNLAMGPPTSRLFGAQETQSQTARILRALAIVYGLVDVPESVNSVLWTFGQTQNKKVSFKLPINANFNCKLEDALWVLKKITDWEPEVFEEFTKDAQFPDPVAEVLAERLKSRRNSIANRFKPLHARKIEYHTHASDEDGTILNGKVIQKKWDGYASQFSGDGIESPFQHLRHYAFSIIESNLITNLVSKANSMIPQLNIQNQTNKHFEQISQQWFTTGQPQQMPIKAWTAPLIDGGIDISRNVVLGNYLGTNNLVQLADTFGVHLNFGLLLSFDHLPTGINGQGLVQGGVSMSLTHIKPITKIKQALTEPIQNTFVHWVYGNAHRVLQNTADLKPKSGDKDKPQEIADALTEELSQLRDHLGKGESLILTESLNGAEQISAGLGVPLVSIGPSINLTPGANQLVLSRVQIYRKDENTIQVFKDHGQLAGYSLAFAVNLSAGNFQIPILAISGKRTPGHAKSKIFKVNISPHLETNPNIYYSAHAVAQTIRSGSTELLEALQKNLYASISMNFDDHSSNMQLVHWVRRTLKGNGKIHVALADGKSGDYIALSNGKQKGKNYQQVATQLATYFTQRFTNDNTYSFTAQSSTNAGQTFLGKSHTRDAQFQASLLPEMEDPFVGVQYRWEGWSLKNRKVNEIIQEIHDRYDSDLFSSTQIHDAEALQLYNISLNFNIYEAGIKKILSMSEETQYQIEEKYREENRCALGLNPICASIRRFHRAFEECRSGLSDPTAQAHAYFTVVSELERFIEFKELVPLVGNERNPNYYLYSQINGAQKGSEFKNAIPGNSLGKIPARNTDGILNFVQNILGIDNGEFQAKWLRDIL